MDTLPADILLSPDGQFLAVGGIGEAKGSILVYDVNSGQKVFSMDDAKPKIGYYTIMSFSPKSDVLAALVLSQQVFESHWEPIDLQLNFVDLKSMDLLRSDEIDIDYLNPGPGGFGFSPSGYYLLIGGEIWAINEY